MALISSLPPGDSQSNGRCGHIGYYNTDAIFTRNVYFYKTSI